jgi:hypothetical protein
MPISRNLPEKVQCDENPQDNRILSQCKDKIIALPEYWVQVAEIVKVKQSHYRPGRAPEGSRILRLPDFKTFGI